MRLIALRRSALLALALPASLVLSGCPDDSKTEIAPLEVITSELPAGLTGAGYGLALRASGGVTPYSWVLSSGTLPTGLGLDGGGAIAGVPLEAGSFDLTLTVADAQIPPVTASVELTLDIGLGLTFEDGTLPPGEVGMSYEASVVAQGGSPPYTYALAGGLPPGLAFDTSSGAISGIPTAAVSTLLDISVTDAATPPRRAEATFLLAVEGALSFIVPRLPEAEEGVAYEFALSTSGGVPPYSYSVTGGAAPPGLSLGDDGVLSGTPTDSGEYRISVRVEDSDTPPQSAAADLRIFVAGPLAISTPEIPEGAVGAPYGAQLQAIGGRLPYTWSLVDPQQDLLGIQLLSEGVFFGQPTTAGEVTIDVQVRDASTPPQTVTNSYRLRVSGTIRILTETLPVATVGQAYALQLQAVGADGATWTVSGGDNALPEGITLGRNDGLISGTPLRAGDHPLLVIADVAGPPARTARQSMLLRVVDELSLDALTRVVAAPEEAIQLRLRAAGGEPPYDYRVAGGSLLEGLGLDAFTGVVSGSVALESSAAVTFEVSDQGTPPRSANIIVTFSIIDDLPQPDSLLPDGVVDRLYSAMLRVPGQVGALTWQIVDGVLPTGLALDANSGQISGTPTQAGDFTILVEAEDEAEPPRISRGLVSLRIIGAVEILSTALRSGVVGVEYLSRVEAFGGVAPYTFAIDDGGDPLPAGLGLSADTVSGVPTQSGSFNVEVTVTDSAVPPLTASATLPLAIADPLVPTGGRLPDGTLGRDYATVLSAVGGEAPVIWAVTAGALPAGLSMDQAGAISGRPEATGTFPVVVTATDSGDPSQSVSAEISIDVRPPISLVQSTLTPGVQNRAYQGGLSLAGGTPPYTVSIAPEELPPGLFLDAETQELRGTPTQVGVQFFVFTATDSGNPARELTASASVSVAPELVLPPQTLPPATVGVAYQAELVGQGGVAPRTWRLANGELPPPLTLGTGTGVISGTPQSAGRFFFSLELVDSGNPRQIESRLFSIEVAEALSVSTGTLPPALAGQPYSARLQAEGGRAPYSFALAAGALPAGITLADDGTLSGQSAEVGVAGFVVRVTDASDPPLTAQRGLSLTVSSAVVVTPPVLPEGAVGADYDVQLAVAGGVPPHSFVLVAGALPDGVQLAADGRLSGAPTEAGSFPIVVRATDADDPALVVDAARELIVRPGLQVLAQSLPDAAIGVPYLHVLEHTAGEGAVFDLSVGALPSGLTLDASAGVISGVPDGSAGRADFTARVSDAGLEAERALSIEVFELLRVTSDEPATGAAGSVYNYAIDAVGGRAPLTFAVVDGGLPPGLSLDAQTGIVSGQLGEAGSFSVVVLVSDDATPRQRTSVALDFEVTAGFAITTVSLPDGRVGQLYDELLAAAGGTEPYTWNLLAGTLPGDMTLANSGRLSGTPDEAGSTVVTVQVCDDSGGPACTQRDLTLVVAEALVIQTAALPVAIQEVAYDQTLVATGGVAPFTWSVVAPTALPLGLNLSTAGQITGSPLQPGPFNVDFRVIDSGAPPQQADVSLTLTVRAGLVVVTELLPRATVGEAYDQSISAAGGIGPYSFSLVDGALPGGMTLDGDGRLHGTPNEGGAFNFIVRAEDSDTPPQQVEVELALTSSAELRIDTIFLPRALVQEAYGQQVAISGGTPPYVVTLADGSALPAGLSLSTGGFLSGVPTIGGTSSFNIDVADSGEPQATANAELTLQVRDRLVIDPRIPPDAVVGLPYSYDFTASGGFGQLEWSVDAGNLPAGTDLSAAGVLSGTPSGAGTFDFTLRVTDDDAPAQTATQSYSIIVGAPRTGETCADPLALDHGNNGGSVSVVGSTTTAGGDLEGTCGGLSAPDRVYTFVLSERSRVDLVLDTDDSFQGVLYVRGAPCNSGVELGCWAGGARTEASLVLGAGTYFAMVDSAAFTGGGTYTLDLNVSALPNATNDTCATAQLITPDAVSGIAQIQGSTQGAANDENGGCGGSGGEVVYQLSLSVPTTVDIQVDTRGSFDPIAYLRDAPCDSGGERFCSSGVAGIVNDSRVLPAGDYFLFVDTDSQDPGIFNLTVSVDTGFEAGELCQNAIELLPDPSTGIAVANGDSTGHNNDYSGSCGGDEAADDVYFFTLTEAKELTITLDDLGFFDSVLFVRGGNCETGDELRCVDEPEPAQVFGVFEPGTYWVFVEGGAAAAEGQYELTLELSDRPITPPGGDTCAAATPLAFDAVEVAAIATGDTSALTDTESPPLGCRSNFHSAAEAIYSFSLAERRDVTITLDDRGTFDSVLYLRSADCEFGDIVACVDDPEPQRLEAVLDPGDYFVFVDGYASGTGTYRLEADIDVFVDEGPDSCGVVQDIALDEVTHAASINGELFDQVDDDFDGFCGGAGGKDHVYRLVLTEGGILDVGLNTGGEFSGVLYMRADDSCPGFRGNEIGCVAAPSATNLSRLVEAGTYYIFVDALTADQLGTYTLNVALDPDAFSGGDTCDDATLFGTDAEGEATLFGETSSATNAYEASCAFATQNERVYTFNLAEPKTVSLTLTASDFDSVIELREGTCETGNVVDCFDEPEPQGIRADLPAGSYFIFVDSSFGAGGTYQLDVDLDVGAPAAEECTGQGLEFNASDVATVNGTTVFAANDEGAACGGGAGKDLVYRFRQDTFAPITVTLDADFESVLYLLSGDCTVGDSLGCEATPGQNPKTITTGDQFPGWFWVFVDAVDNSESGNFTLTVER